MFRAINRTKNSVVAEEVEPAKKFLRRLKGLLGRSSLPAGHGLWIEPCNSIHTFFMLFSIDAAFLSTEGAVIRTFENLSPFRVTPPIGSARSVLELPSGALKQASVQVGDQIVFEKKGSA